MSRTLDEYQVGLLVDFVEAARRGKDVRPEFTYYPAPPDERPIFRGNGLRKDLATTISDLEAFESFGLISRENLVASVGHITLLPLAFTLYDTWKTQPGPPKKTIGF